MYDITEFRDLLLRLIEILEAVQVRYYLTGGAAAIAYADPRTTQDIDLVIDAPALQLRLPEFLDHCHRRQFMFHEETVRHALKSGRQFQLIDLVSTLKVDLYPHELVAGGLDRAVEILVAPGLSLLVASRPDLAVSKLIWISKGSHKSRRDVKQIMRRVTEAERAMVYEFADQLSLRSLLEEVLAEPDEIDA